MYKLVIKDLWLIKKYFLFALIYVPFFMFAFQKMEQSMLPAGIVGITYVLVTTACASDDKNKADILLNSLPVKRAKIVIAKYLSIILYTILGITEYAAIYWIIKITGIPFQVAAITFENLFGAFFAVFLMNSIYFPLYFKYGYMKSRIFNFVLFFGFFFGIGLISNLIKRIYEHNAIIENVIKYFINQTDFLIVSELTFVLVFMLLVSILISLKIYKNKEF